LTKKTPPFLEALLPELFKKKLTLDTITAADEIYVYFIDSFGSYERLDYGTGFLHKLIIPKTKDMN